MEEMETLGKYLKRERELRKISIRELSKNTRVREHILKALEEDRYDLLPSPTFVKGFLTAYAKYVGLDLNDILNRYQHVLKGAPEGGPDVKPENKVGANVKPAWVLRGAVVGGAVLAGLILFYFFYLHPSKPPVESLPVKPAQQEAPTPPTSSPQIEETNPPPEGIPSAPALTPTPSPAPTPSPVQSAGTNLPGKEKPISLQIKAVETTWLNIKVDDQPDRDVTLRPGEGLPLDAVNRINLLVGNAGGLDLVHNGKALERFGKTGEVVALTFTPQGVDVKRYEKSKPQ